MEHVQRIAPVVLVNEMVPIRDHVVHRTAVVTIGNPAIHAARGLTGQRLIVGLHHKFAIIFKPFFGLDIIPLAAIQFEKSGVFTHLSCLYSAATLAASRRSASSASNARL